MSLKVISCLEDRTDFRSGAEIDLLSLLDPAFPKGELLGELLLASMRPIEQVTLWPELFCLKS